jgi:adenine-specific DNA-methyltransferase
MSEVRTQELFEFDAIKGYPRLHWQGKRPFLSTQYYPAQKHEVHGVPCDDWINKLYWGDNLQVMSHLLPTFRGKFQLIYIDPPFDSKADYKKVIKVKGHEASNDYLAFEEKQYTDLWSNDEYLQFMYERLTLFRELLHPQGIFVLHCDFHKSHHLRCLIEEVFGNTGVFNEVVWKKIRTTKAQSNSFGNVHDLLFFASKTNEYNFENQYNDFKESYIKSHYKLDPETSRLYRTVSLLQKGSGPARTFGDKTLDPPADSHWIWSQERINQSIEEGRIRFTKGGRPEKIQFLDEMKGDLISDFWDDIYPINSQAIERLNYPTQKPEKLIERILNATTKPGDIVFDGFMGSGTTQAVAMRMGRKFVGADINLAAIQVSTNRLIECSRRILIDPPNQVTYFTGIEVYNVNNYDIFRNPVQAKELILEALEINSFDTNNLYDGEKDGRMVKLMPVNRIATRADLNELITGFDRKVFDKRRDESPNKPVERILVVCMGHEPDLAAYLKQEVEYDLDIEIVDILRDNSNLEFKHDSEADIILKSGDLIVNAFYPMNLLQKLSIVKEDVKDWKELVDSIMIDWNYDGSVLKPDVVDVPSKNAFVKGLYEMPIDTGKIRIKITDLLSESLEMDI